MQTVAIVGVGLIGGSFGLALRAAGFTGEIVGVSSPKTIASAVELGAIDRGVTLEEAAAIADLILLAQPISVILETIDRLKALVRPDCLVTDAGSTKSVIVERAQGLPLFLGGHPMAGKETRGVSVADPGLFSGRTWVLTPISGQEASHPAITSFVHWLSLCKAIPVFLSPSEHDRIVAFTSHLPQLASTALACVVGTQLADETKLSVSGPGLRDTTRLALSSWDIWRDIIGTNSAFIQHSLQVYIDTLTDLRDNLPTQRTAANFQFGADVAGKIRCLGSDNKKEG